MLKEKERKRLEYQNIQSAKRKLIIDYLQNYSGNF